MSYCIFIELSRDSSGLYYYDSESRDKFMPILDEPVVPLAVWFNGNEPIIGSAALTEYKKHNSNAFYNLFDLMSKSDRFSYANEQHEYNKLVLFFIRAALRLFFSRIKYNTLGTLDNNKAHVPLVIMLDDSIKDNERGIITNQLIQDGFGNFEIKGQDDFVLSAYRNHLKSKPFTTIASGSDNDLHIAIYQGFNLKKRFDIPFGNIDPRLDRMAELIFERTQAQYDYLSIDQEKDVLLQAANDFLSSGRMSINAEVILSNGQRYSYFLEQSDIRMLQINNGVSVVSGIIDQLAYCGAKRADSSVILMGTAAKNSYLYDQLKSDFQNLLVINDETRETLLAYILNYANNCNFVFRSGSIKVGPSDEDYQQKASLMQNVDISLRCGNYDSAMSELNAFIAQMHSKSIHDFDNELNALRAKIDGFKRTYAAWLQTKESARALNLQGNRQGAVNTVNEGLAMWHSIGVSTYDSEASALINSFTPITPPLTPIWAPEPPEPPISTVAANEADKKYFRNCLAEVRASIANNRFDEALRKLNVLDAEMKRRGVVEFNDKIATVRAQIQERSGQPGPSTTAPVTPPPPISDGKSPSLTDRRDFKELKRNAEKAIMHGNFASAQKQLKEFADRMAAKGVTVFQDEINQLMSRCR